MKREEFRANFDEAIKTTFDFGQRFVLQTLPEKLVFHVYPNHSFDGNPLEGDEELFPDDSLEDGKYLEMTTDGEVLDFLWRSEKIPEWVDISVESASDNITVMRLLCCGRYTASFNLLYHRSGGMPPFAIKSPDLPIGYDHDLEPESGKFDVNWKQKKQNKWRLRTLLRRVRSA